MTTLKQRIEKELEKKAIKYGIMGTECITIKMALTNEEKEEFFAETLPVLEREHDGRLAWEMAGDVLEIGWSEKESEGDEGNMTLAEWQEKMMMEVEGTVTISRIMSEVPFKTNTSRYQVYNADTYDQLFDITLADDGETILKIE